MKTCCVWFLTSFLSTWEEGSSPSIPTNVYISGVSGTQMMPCTCLQRMAHCHVQKGPFFSVWSLIYKIKTRVFHMSAWMSPELFFRSQRVRRTLAKVMERLRYCPAAGIQIMGLGACQKSRSSALNSCFSISCLLPSSPANEVGSSTDLWVYSEGERWLSQWCLAHCENSHNC